MIEKEVYLDTKTPQEVKSRLKDYLLFTGPEVEGFIEELEEGYNEEEIVKMMEFVIGMERAHTSVKLFKIQQDVCIIRAVGEEKDKQKGDKR